MKTIFCILIFITILLLSCKNENNFTDNSIINDSIKYYLDKVRIEEDNKIADSLNNNAYTLIQKVDNSQMKREFLYSVISNYFITENWQNYLKSSKSLLNESINGKDTTNIANAFRSLGNYYYKNNSIDSSFYFYTKADKIYFKLKQLNDYSTILYKKAIIQTESNDYFGAYLNLKKALIYVDKNNNDKKLYNFYSQLGLVSIELEEYDNGINYFNKSIDLLENSKIENSDELKSHCYNNIGYSYIKRKLFKEASINFELGLLNKNLKIKNPDLYSYLIDNLAFCQMKLNNFTNLPDKYYEALRIRDSLKSLDLIVLSDTHLSEYYHITNDSINAIKYSDSAIKVANESKNPFNLKVALQTASTIDRKKAASYSIKYIKLVDSLQIAERNSRDLFARIQLETDELKQENTTLTVKNKNILYIFGVFAILVSILFFVRHQRMRAREFELKQAQQQANEEIYRLIISHQHQLDEGKDFEKKRISKELHDGILGRLFGLRLNLDGLNNYDDDDAKTQRLDFLSELQIIEQDLREISHDLNRENMVIINNFLAIINSLLDNQSKLNSFKINSYISNSINWDEVTNIRKINIYRILQEALQNINKYAQANVVDIKLDIDAVGNFLFIVEDDGIGFNVNRKKSKGIGTKNMLERVKQCNGTIEFLSEINNGTKIIINLPPEKPS